MWDLKDITHWNLVLVADFSNFGNLLGAARKCHCCRELIDVDGRPFRESMISQVIVISADPVFSKFLSDLPDCLRAISVG